MSEKITGKVSGEQIVRGSLIPRGNDGFSPIVEIIEVEGGQQITVTDISGTKNAVVKDGAAGKDGMPATHSWNGTRLVVSSANGTSSADLKGERGEAGPAGRDGVGIAEIKQIEHTNMDRGRNTLSITLDNGNKHNFFVYNGSKGSAGEAGQQGEKGAKGDTGRTPGLWLAPTFTSADAVEGGMRIGDLQGVVTPTVDTVFEGDMVLCKDGGVVFVSNLDITASGSIIYVDCIGGSVNLHGEDGKNASFWLVPTMTAEELLLDYIYAHNLVGTNDTATVSVGDLILCKDGGVLYVGELRTLTGGTAVFATPGNNAASGKAAVYLNGDSPYIGDNGNWWIGEEDTGVEAGAKEIVMFRISNNGSSWALNNATYNDLMAAANAGKTIILYTIDSDGSRSYHYCMGTRNVDGVGGLIFQHSYGTTLQNVFASANGITVETVDVQSGGSGGGGAAETVVTVGFGAQDFVCDGVADDVEILAAINSLPAEGGTVILYPGNYNITATLKPQKSNVRIVGKSTNTSKYGGSSTPDTIMFGSVGILYPKGTDWQIAGITFVGEGANTAVNLNSLNGNVEVLQCLFGYWNTAINGSDSSTTRKSTTVRGCTFQTSNYGVSTPNNAGIIDNVFIECGRCISNPANCTINGNTMLDCNVGIGSITYGGNSITGNTVKRGKGTATDYAEDQHTILLGNLDTDKTTVLYGNRNVITNNFLHGKDVTILNQATAPESSLAELATCFIKDNLASGMGGADWNAAEGEPGHVLNRTHYEENRVLLELENAEFTDPGIGVYVSLLPVKLGLVNGEVYTVIWDGVPYECVAEVSNINGNEALGNTLPLGGENTGEPFVYVDMGGGMVGIVDVMATSNTQHTVSVEKSDIHKIDNKYIDADWLAKKKVQPKLTDVIPETTVDFQAGENASGGTMFVAQLMAGEATPFVTGETYVLVLDGVEHTCVAKEDSFFDGRMYYLGEPSLAGFNADGEGENFFVFVATGEGVTNAYIVATTSGGTHTVRVGQSTGETEVVYNKLPVEYLPDSAATKEYVEQVILGGAW